MTHLQVPILTSTPVATRLDGNKRKMDRGECFMHVLFVSGCSQSAQF